MRTHRSFGSCTAVVAIAVSAVLLAGCGAERAPAQSRTELPDPPGQVALLLTETGIAAVDAGTTRTRWSQDGAVGALDGSAVFARGSGILVRLNPRTGEEIASWPIEAPLHPIVVAPDGRWVALTDRDAYDSTAPATGSTKLVVVNGSSGAKVAQFDFPGNVEPEAFSPDGARLVVLDHHEVGYRVQTLDITTGERSDTIDEDKDPVGDMTGHRVRGVLSEDRSMLATLYQDPDDPEEPAFVHVLQLSGWTYCVDLPAAFGESPDGNVLIERSGDDVIVISEHADQRAQFSLEELRQNGTQGLHLTVTAGAGERADAAYVDVPGYRALIATF